jgi:hypothetical protein
MTGGSAGSGRMNVTSASRVRPERERDGIQRKRPKDIEQRAAEAAIA